MKIRLQYIPFYLTLLAIVASLLSGAVTVSPARAASFTVGTAAELIAAINTANSNEQDDTITLTNDIVLTDVYVDFGGNNGLPLIDADGGKNLTIDGAGYSISRSSAGGTPVFRLFYITAGASVTLQNLTFSNGSTGSPGGAILNAGTLTVKNSSFISNTAGRGGAIHNSIYAVLNIQDSVFTGNSTTSLSGGAIDSAGYSVIISGSTFTGNTTVLNGGAISMIGGDTLSITNSTFVNNTAASFGGGVYNSANYDVEIINTTFFNNAAGDGGAVYNESGSVTLKNSLLAVDLFGMVNCGGSITAGADNIATDTTCASATPISFNQLKLGTLGSHGGSTQTIPLLTGSPAIDHANADEAACPDEDQRGVTRDSSCDVGAFEYVSQFALSFAVYTNDSEDGSTGNERPAAIGEKVTYRLKAVLPESTSISYAMAGALPAGMDFVSGSAQVSYLANTSPNLNGDFSGIQNESDPTFSFPASRINFDPDTRALEFSFGSVINNDGDSDREFLIVEFDAVVKDVVDNSNGAIRDFDFDLVIDEDLPTEVILTSNQIGIILVEPDISLSKTFTPNSQIPGETVTMTLVVSNLSSNGATAPVFDLTVSDTLEDLLDVTNIDVSFNAAATTFGSTFTDNSMLTAGFAAGVSDEISVDISGLPVDGEATVTVTLQVDPDAYIPSLPINFSNTAFVSGDSLASDITPDDEDRAYSTNASDDFTVSAVTVEAQTGPNFIVNSNLDTDDGVCAILTENDCTLREAINAANANADASTITFVGDYIITLNGSQLPVITEALTITGIGPTSADTIIQASTCDPVNLPDSCTPSVNRVFLVSSTGNLTLDTLTVRYGYCDGTCPSDPMMGGIGGGILNNGILTITNSTISNNRTNFSAGGIYSLGSSSLTVNNSTIANNSTGSQGGGMWVSKGTVTNSTIVGNSAFLGGGVFKQPAAPSDQWLIIVNSTISGNNIHNNGSGISIANSIINNSNCTSTAVTDAGNNLDSGNTCAFTVNALVNTDPLLGALADNGGPTQTMALPVDSPAIDMGKNTGCPTADQRGVARPQGAACDIGAYEYESAIEPGSLTFKSNGKQDGWVLESSEASNTGGTLNRGSATLLLGDDALNRQYRSILSFNTSAIPDGANITSVTLFLKRAGSTNGNPFNLFNGLMVDVRKGTFGKPALQLADFKGSKVGTYGPFKPPLLLDGWLTGWYVIDLTPAASRINDAGLTQIRLRFQLDDNNNFTANLLRLYSGNAAAKNRPQLFVEYGTP